MVIPRPRPLLRKLRAHNTSSAKRHGAKQNKKSDSRKLHVALFRQDTLFMCRYRRPVPGHNLPSAVTPDVGPFIRAAVGLLGGRSMRKYVAWTALSLALPLAGNRAFAQTAGQPS